MNIKPDIVYVNAIEPMPLLGGRRFWEIHNRLSRYYTIMLVQPSYSSKTWIEEKDGIFIYHVPYIAKLYFKGSYYLLNFGKF